jgi:hypothetical protein
MEHEPEGRKEKVYVGRLLNLVKEQSYIREKLGRPVIVQKVQIDTLGPTV